MTEVRRPRIVLDCDPGYDDAIAILCAVAYAELAAVTTVAGNRDVDETTANAHLACRVFGYGGDLARGASRPLVQAPPPSAPMEPLSAQLDDDGACRATPRVRADLDAAGLIVETSCAATWLVTTGPLTNAALALRRDPTLASRLAGISVLGGSAAIGNVSATAEFNVWADPEAAQIVLSSGARLRLCGLDVTHDVLVDDVFTRELRELRTACGVLVARWLDVYIRTYPDAFVGASVAPLHDPCAVLAVTHPHLFRWRSFHVAVELAGTLTRGMTVIDRRDRPSSAPNVELAVGCDRDAILATIRGAVERQSSEPASRFSK